MLGCKDENFNKKPNSAKNKPEKGRTDYGQKKVEFFMVLLFFYHAIALS